jgi:hypothetical protein
MCATFFRSAFMERMILSTVGVTFCGMPFGLPPLLTGGGVSPALTTASISAYSAPVGLGRTSA